MIKGDTRSLKYSSHGSGLRDPKVVFSLALELGVRV